LTHAASSTDDFIVLVTDAIATIGARGAALQKALGAFPKTSKLFVLNIGTKLDKDVAVAITGLGGGRVVSLAATANSTVAMMRMATAWDDLLAPVGISGTVVPGSANIHVHPKNFYDLQPGSEVVYVSWSANGTFPYHEFAKTALVVGNSTLTAGLASAVDSTFAPLLEREGVRAEIAMLNDQLSLQTNSSLRTETEKKIVSLSTTKRVLSPLTALLVLETEADYRRFGIDRNALNDILEISEKGITLKRPSAPTFAYNGKRLEMDADEPDSRAISTGKGESYATTSAAPGSTLPGMASMAPVLALAYAGHVGIPLGQDDASRSGAKPGTPSPRIWEVVRVGTQVGAAAALVAVAGMLQGCMGGSNDGDRGHGRKWLNVTEWATKHMARKLEPTNRNRKDASMWAEALAGTNQPAALHKFAKAWLLWDPSNAGTYEHIGTSALALNDLDTALRAFTGLAETSSSNPAELLRSAWLCLKARQTNMAVQLAHRAIQQREDNPNAYRALGIAHYMDGKLADAQAAYKAARWRPAQKKITQRKQYINGTTKMCSSDRGRRGGRLENDQRTTPHLLLEELGYMEYHKGVSNANIGLRILTGKACEAEEGCADIKSATECAEAAATLHVPLNGKGVIDDSACKENATLQCVLSQDGYVRLWEKSRSWDRRSPGHDERFICKCPSKSTTPVAVSVVLSWLGDGNDVDLHMKGKGFDVKNSFYDVEEGPGRAFTSGLADVQFGLGPELLRTTAKGRIELGVYYNWASAMGSARGVLVVWDYKNKEPAIIPFSLPAGEYNIISVANIDVTADRVKVSGDLLYR